MGSRRDPETGKTRRGTSNGNERGSAEGRRRRRAWLLETYRADVDVVPLRPSLRLDYTFVSEKYPEGHALPGPGRVEMERMTGIPADPAPLGEGEMACRCYRCGCLLTIETLTVDRIIPGALGGTYRRNNIRPACAKDNSETGAPLANGTKHKAAKAAAKKRAIKKPTPTLELGGRNDE